MKHSRVIFILIVIFIVIVLIISGKLVISPTRQQTEIPATPTPTVSASQVSVAEQQAIETWIEENNLNFFGDPQDTVYAGGTPLYNEMTGETIERFTYIVNTHPDRPWNE